MRERRHAGEAGMRGRDGGNEEAGGEEKEGGDHLCYGGVHPPDTSALLCIYIFFKKLCVLMK